MDTGESRSLGLIVVVVALAAVVLVPALPAVAANESCYYDPELGLVCEDGGEGGEEEENPLPTDFWTSWQIVGACGGASGEGGFINISTGLVLAIRDHIMDGEVVETQGECIDFEDGEDEIGDELASAIRSTGAPALEVEP